MDYTHLLIIQLLGLSILNILYYSGQFLFAIKSGICNRHYFLGYNPRLFDVTLSGIRFSIGIYIPIYPFSRIYKIEEGKKERVTMVWEFTNFPIWKRLIVSFGGTITLIVTSIIIFMAIAYVDVEKYISKEEVNKLGIYPTALSKKAGFVRGDKILLINGEDYTSFTELINPEEGSIYRISRAGKTLDLSITNEVLTELHASHEQLFLYLDSPVEVREVMKGSYAEEAGLKIGDLITRINDTPVVKQFEIQKELSKDNDGEVLLTIERFEGQDKKIVNLNSKVSDTKTIGVLLKETIHYSIKETTIGEAMARGFKKPFQILASNIFYIVKPKKTFTTIDRIGPAYQPGIQWKRFWMLTGSYTIIIAFFNFLPLPRCCFWELIPLGYEKIVRKNFAYKKFKILTKLGYIIIGVLMTASIISDFMRHLG